MTISHIICIDEHAQSDVDIKPAVFDFGEKNAIEFDIHTCTSGQRCIDFIRACEQKGEHVCCVVTGVRLPDMTGQQLFGHLSETNPRLGQIVIAGFAEMAQTLSWVRAELRLTRYIEKCCDAQLFKESVASALDGFVSLSKPALKPIY
ncbi:MAG: hypothetical protein MJK04_01705 [Psychrosphaera sp.]|nr:hypothetical protein [Psychrosphaera sp.]